jgi:hypothetical protein
MSDINLTQKLVELFSIPMDKRDAVWQQSFHAAVPEASLRALNPQVIQGPDGFPYFALAMPKAGEKFESFCIAHVLDTCLNQGFGAVIFGDPAGQPLWVFKYGDLSSYQSYKRFDGDPADEPSGLSSGHHEEVVNEARQVLVGSPSESFLPLPARAVIRQFLSKRAGLAKPAVALVSDPALKPNRNLVFNLYREHFKDPADFDCVMQQLLWFLPRRRGLISIKLEDSQFHTL